MKICVNSRQSRKVLNQADEILVEYRDRNSIIDLGHDYNATIILDIPYVESENLDWIKINEFKILSKDNFILKLHSINIVNECKNNNIKFFLDYNVRTFYELNSISKLGVEYIKVDAPIFFEMDKVKNYNIPLRIDPTVTNYSIFNDVNPTTGTWIRPEDLYLYEPCTVEFIGKRLAQEETLIKVYRDDKQWSASLNLLIENIDSNALNRIIDENFGARRLNCGQKCQQPTKNGGSPCHYCDIVLKIASMKDKLTKYKETVDKK